MAKSKLTARSDAEMRQFFSDIRGLSAALAVCGLVACGSSTPSLSSTSDNSISGASTTGGSTSGGSTSGGSTSGGSTSGGSTSGGSISGGSMSGGSMSGGSMSGGSMSGGSMSGGSMSGGSMSEAAGESGSGGGAHSTKGYLCNVFLGVSVTHDWFINGFETTTGVDGARFEALASAQAEVSFIQNWAEPTSNLWSMAKLSPCTQHADLPDRVILVGVNWDYTTQAEWEAAYEKVIATIRSKFPGVKEIDLMTLLRAPGNISCGNIESVVQPFIDLAIASEVEKHPNLVQAAPKVYAPSCSVFANGGPHFTAAGVKVVAGVYGAFYGSEL